MKCLIINGCPTNDKTAATCSKYLTALLTEHQISNQHVKLAETYIKGCIGCLNCFFKSPGECRFKDLGRDLPQYFIKSDISVFMSPVTFGGFSACFAKAYNRMVIQLESHLGEVACGELRRRKRFNTAHPSVLAIGVIPAQDQGAEKIFTDLIQRNTRLHLHSPSYEVVIMSSDQSVDQMKQQLKTSFANIRR